ncbi:MAG: hypothetical protein ACQEUT_09070 [Bacillota bacterium]
MTETFVCEKCGHTKSKTGRIGNSNYDSVKKPGKIISGTAMLIKCCASCGNVDSMTIEDPDKL